MRANKSADRADPPYPARQGVAASPRRDWPTAGTAHVRSIRRALAPPMRADKSADRADPPYPAMPPGLGKSRWMSAGHAG